MPDLWPHQQRGIEQTLAAIAAGQRRICLAMPTGGGKTKMAVELVRTWLDTGWRVAYYTNRKMLTEQTSNVFLDAGIYHGVRAAGYEDEREHRFQLCSIQTEFARSGQYGWDLHPADRVIVDEGHLMTGDAAKAILKKHHKAGAAIVLLTATPLGMAEVADTLIVAGTTSELRACGALVPAVHFGPDEPDLKSFKGLAPGTLPTDKENAKAMAPARTWGSVWKWFQKLNPDASPTLLFAPGVPESLWFAEEFTRKGVPAAHIDGQEVWLDGKLYPTTPALRAEILERSKDGRIRVLCNRFVLREGIDAPWLRHGIFATVFGSLQSYLQSGGRLLRAYPGIDEVTIQDHGGNWWRHGSLNEDREWRLDATEDVAAAVRADRLRRKEAREPFRCPQCGRIWVAGRLCNPARGGCGYELASTTRSRPVVALDGTLKQMHGDIFKARRISRKPNGAALWERMYWRSYKLEGGRTFRQAQALFAKENDWGWPDPTWPAMPRDLYDASLPVHTVPFERLTAPPSSMTPR